MCVGKLCNSINKLADHLLLQHQNKEIELWKRGFKNKIVAKAHFW
jgi:hypothetical protein